jgi:hypothetical protein
VGSSARLLRVTEQRPDLDELKRRLMAIGGTRFQVDDFLASELEPAETELLMTVGRMDATGDLELREMEMSGCHRNVRTLLEADPTLEWRFGMALSHDDIWRVHSWAHDGRRVIETTEPRTTYVGIDMARLLGLRSGVLERAEPPGAYEAAAERLGPLEPGRRGAPMSFMDRLRRWRGRRR